MGKQDDGSFVGAKKKKVKQRQAQKRLACLLAG